MEEKLYAKSINGYFVKDEEALRLHHVIPNDTDMNDLIETGIYSTGGASGITNLPPVIFPEYAFIIVLAEDNVCHQYYIKPASNDMYIREYSDYPPVWSAWQKVSEADYSEIENLTGARWVNFKPIYRKVIELGYLPNTDTKHVLTNIDNIDEVTKLYGIAYDEFGSFPLPFVSVAEGGGNNVEIFYQIDAINGNNITITTDGDLSQALAYAIIEYTKNPQS